MTNMMKRWQISAAGRQTLELADVPVPVAGPGEVLVRVKAVSLNYRDRLFLENQGYAQFALPFTPASDLAGEVQGVGPGVTRFKAGDRVINNFTAGWIDGPPPRVNGVNQSFGGPLPGVLAEYVALPAEWLVAAPATLDDAEASTLPCAALTAWTSLVELGGLRPGETVLVQGTGGVSLFALQFAAAMGAEVIVTSSGEEKLERAKALGATHGINRETTPDWAEAVLGITSGRGADHILEMVGGTNLGRSMAAIAPSGRISLIGVIGGFESSLPSFPAFQAQATVQAIFVGNRRGLENMVRAVDRIGLKPVIDTQFAFADLPDGLDRLERGPFGKIVIRVSK
ncbi:alcohol dehydrogenase [Sphingomonas oleivorans]|uniref:Alcohol dehydrogenase n=1 Tax=Sphingomonas oleivorans TaxID=1735121 RepID=A0A2T5G0M7_9SPHN|nr:NAD(P)-dependent alcohol dehydrogenase [Sphingomonas oleivorans]PTQ12715.1 alcohol dehydrogenase [Sphingomonas oleivorans]